MTILTSHRHFPLTSQPCLRANIDGNHVPTGGLRSSDGGAVAFRFSALRCCPGHRVHWLGGTSARSRMAERCRCAALLALHSNRHYSRSHSTASWHMLHQFVPWTVAHYSLSHHCFADARTAAAVECACCQSTFTILNRKHHCRVCGVIYCSQCLLRSLPYFVPEEEEEPDPQVAAEPGAEFRSSLALTVCEQDGPEVAG